MRALALALLLVASPLGASSRRVRVDSSRYADAWARVEACSGRAPIAGHELSHLVIFAVPTLSLDGRRIYAEWVEGDSLFVDASVSDTSWIVRHEMLHMLLQGPAGNDKHPMTPFAFPCLAMPYQHTPGGIMGSHS